MRVRSIGAGKPMGRVFTAASLAAGLLTIAPARAQSPAPAPSHGSPPADDSPNAGPRAASYQSPPAPASDAPPASATTSVPPVATPGTEAGPAPHQEARSAGPFSRGAVRLTATAGTGILRYDSYLLLGAGVGYFLVDGLTVGIDYLAWIGGTPFVQQVSPEIRYVFHFVPIVQPYVGNYYRHAFIADYDDLDYIGTRAGVYWVPSQSRVYVGAGAAYERALACNDSAVTDCDVFLPELAIGISL